MRNRVTTSLADHRWFGPALVLAGGLCIAYAPIGLRLSEAAGFGPQAAAFWRYALALPVLALVLVLRGQGFGSLNVAIGLAGLCFGLDIALWHEALVRTSVANATFFVNLGSLTSGLAAFLVLSEPLAARWFGAILFAAPGAALLSFGADDAGSAHWTGDLLALGAAVMVAGYLLGSRRARRSLDGFQAIFWATLVALAVGAGAVWVRGESLTPEQPAAWPAVLSLGLVVQVLGQGLILTGLGRTPVAISGVLVLIQPVAAALLAALLFGERMTGWQGIGAALIVVALTVAGTAGSARSVPARPGASR